MKTIGIPAAFAYVICPLPEFYSLSIGGIPGCLP